MYIDKVDSPDTVVQYSQIGRRALLYCTGVGKAILANFPRKKREAFFEKVPLKNFTAKTITSRVVLEEELDAVRQQGYAVDNGVYNGRTET